MYAVFKKGAKMSQWYDERYQAVCHESSMRRTTHSSAEYDILTEQEALTYLLYSMDDMHTHVRSLRDRIQELEDNG